MIFIIIAIVVVLLLIVGVIYMRTRTCLARGSPVFIGCGYAYGSKEQADQQCRILDGALQFVGDGIPDGNPCLLPRETVMYSGCGYLYASRAEMERQCGAAGPTYKWIGDGL